MIPVVLMTALNAVEDRVRGIEAGADDFLSKPVDDRELLARIRTALSLKRAIDETFGEPEHERPSGALRTTGAEVAVIAVEWRLQGPDQRCGGLRRRRDREAARDRIEALGGMLSEADAKLLVAAFEGPDARDR